MLTLHAAELPHIKTDNGTGQLIVNGRPFLILGGELGNSSAGTAAQADSIIPRLAGMHVNTILMPVAWEQIEPKEGSFDFSILDHWIEVARQHHVHLVPLWFGSWKNAFSNYAPSWVKADVKRFSRAQAVDGTPLEILSTLSAENRRCDGRAFAALMRHIREKDSEQQTVLMVQVENEVGYLGRGRDRSPEANRLFRSQVPETLLRSLSVERLRLAPELASHFNERGRSWSEVFGDAANEVFMAWNYASYIEAVVQAGKKEYALPMYVNAQLPAQLERAGEYPSGGPHPYYLEVYRAVAPSIDFYSPDIYWPNFEYWVQRYEVPGNPIFIPEARMESAPFNAYYAYGEGRAFGFCPFGIDSLRPPQKDDDPKPAIMEVYELLDSFRDLLPAAQASGATRGLVLHATSPRATQTVALGGYLFEATLSRSWPARTIIADDGAMLIMQSAPGEFYVAGSGLTVTITRDPDVDTGIAGIESIEQVTRAAGQWKIERRLNGDQSNQGRQLSLDPHQHHIFRLRLYSFIPKEEDKKDEAKAAGDLRDRIEASPKLPFHSVPLAVQAPVAGWESGLVSGVAIDGKEVIYEMQRGDKADPVLVLDRAGKLLRSWGKGDYRIPHSIRIDPKGNIWTVDASSSIVIKYSPLGKKLMTIAVGDQPETGNAFNGTTDIAFGPNEHVFISDGYGNSRVVEYTPDGKRVKQWGTPGAGPGEFHLPHAIQIGEEGTIYVADRENGRIQKFDLDGKFLGEISHLGRIFSLKLVGHVLWAGVQPLDQPPGSPGWLVKLDRMSGKILGHLDVPEPRGLHAVEQMPSGEPVTTLGNQLLWFKEK